MMRSWCARPIFPARSFGILISCSTRILPPTVQIFDAYLNYRYQPWLQVRAGKFKSPVGLEYLQSDQFTSFNERSLATGLVRGGTLIPALGRSQRWCGELCGGDFQRRWRWPQ